jgi:hypothetical protein
VLVITFKVGVPNGWFFSAQGGGAEFTALDPFFAIVMEGLSKFVDGAHYFDTLDDDVLFEFRYDFPGWPQVTRGRANLVALYSGYGNNPA